MEAIEQVKEEIKQMPEKSADTRSRIRELMTVVMASDIVVEEINILQNDEVYSGYVEFSVPIASMGLNADLTRKFKREIFTRMFVDFIAELAVRENMDAFLKEISNLIRTVDYTNIVGNRKHETSGMCIKENSMVFTFHISLVQDILVSDFKKKA